MLCLIDSTLIYVDGSVFGNCLFHFVYAMDDVLKINMESLIYLLHLKNRMKGEERFKITCNFGHGSIAMRNN